MNDSQFDTLLKLAAVYLVANIVGWGAVAVYMLLTGHRL